MTFCRAPSPVHSARVGIDVEVHYRWHALYGRRVHLHYSEVRAGARLSYVEAAPGGVIVLPNWMLDPGACADMTLGAPQVDVVALKDCVNSSSIAVFAEALPAMSESPRRSKMKLLRKPVVTSRRSQPPRPNL
jgi:hypothetical protein